MPTETAVTRPVAETVATEGVFDCQTTAADVGGVDVTVSWVVRPGVRTVAPTMVNVGAVGVGAV